MDEIHLTQHYSIYTGSSGQIREQGGRTVVLHFDRGDTLDLYCIILTARIGFLKFLFMLFWNNLI